MKTKQNKTLVVVIALAATMAMSSCQKEKLSSQIKNTTNLTWVDDTYNEMLKLSMSMGSGPGSGKTEDANSIAGCATVTDDTVNFPYTRVIDYGSGCVENDGKMHKGQVLLTYDNTDFFHASGSNISVALNNYFVDDNEITGTTTLHNDGVNGNGNITFTFNVDAKRVLASNGGTDSVVGQEIVEWIAGSGTPEKTDDQFSFTGGASGASSNGNNFTMTIIEALIKDRAPGCSMFYVKGETLTQVSGQSDKHLDYGDGTCDDLAIETVDGQSQTITLQ